MSDIRSRMVLCLLVLFVGFALPAGAEGLKFKDGEWRIEVNAVGGVYSGKVERDGDSFYTASVEYAWPIHARATLGLRCYPLFIYHQHGDRETLYGGGLGLALRVFKNKETHTGYYGEGAAAVIGHAGRIEGNESNVDFLLEAGIGYQFENRWHAALKYQHISNGGCSGRNAGANGVGLAFGYTF